MAKTATKAETPPQAIGEYIDINRLETSPTNPRKRFYQDSLDELAGSIGEKGVLEPLIVRAIDAGKFEIVCGERRYRASQIAKLEQLPCILRTLTDDEVLDIQIHENLHREDVHPMDEAYGYKFLMEKLNCSIGEVALRVGKSDKFVAQRLKLNSLIEEAQNDLEAGHLLLTYAMEITKFPPEIQKTILDVGAYQREHSYDSKKQRHVYTPIKGQLRPWSEFTKFLQTEILHLLSAAPFDIKATNLRKDGLTCVTCPDRTGASAGLFDDELVDKKDSCLNVLCFQGKSERLIEITRERIAHETSVKVKHVPTVNFSRYGDSEDGSLGRSDITIIGKKPFRDYYGNVSAKTCEKSVSAVNVDSCQFGKIYTICRATSGCKVHYGRSVANLSGSSSKSKKEQDAELIKKRERREEIFDIRVSDIVRPRVLRLAAEKFVKDFSFTARSKDFLPQLLTKLWFGSAGSGTDPNTLARIITPMMRQITGEKDGFDWSTWRQWNDTADDRTTSVGKAIATLSDTNQKILLFLFVHGNKSNCYSDALQSQKAIRELAEDFGLDHKLFDAEARLQVAEEKAKKHVSAFKLYLDGVRAGDAKAKIPRPYAESYKPKE